MKTIAKVKERPILFSGPMILAILDGRKTMTRRVIENAPAVLDQPGILPSLIEAYKTAWVKTCPYGQPGDRLWVKEFWRVGAWAEDDGKIAVDYKAGPVCRTKWLTVPDPDKFNDLWEGSTQEAEAAYGIKERYKWKPGESPCRWRPSLFMPRWASRITLEITAVRVERVQDISEEDAEREGLRWCNAASPRDKFQCLWDSLNAKRGYGWDANPWVWVITFRSAK